MVQAGRRSEGRRRAGEVMVEFGGKCYGTNLWWKEVERQESGGWKE